MIFKTKTKAYARNFNAIVPCACIGCSKFNSF